MLLITASHAITFLGNVWIVNTCINADTCRPPATYDVEVMLVRWNKYLGTDMPSV